MAEFKLLKPFCLWFTGLPSSGKTTIGKKLQEILKSNNIEVAHLDGDELRKTLCADLSFSNEDRKENNRRAIFLSQLLVEHHINIIVTFITPFAETREIAKKIINNLIEVYTNCPLNICMQRDTKGLYKKALNGEIKEFTGIDSPYEPPRNPDIEISTHLCDPEKGCSKIIDYLVKNKYLVCHD